MAVTEQKIINGVNVEVVAISGLFLIIEQGSIRNNIEPIFKLEIDQNKGGEHP